MAKEETFKVGDFELVNVLKVERAIEAVGDKDEEKVICEYDKLGGLIRHNGAKVITGAFWDRVNGKAIAMKDAKPKILKKQAAVVEEEIDLDMDEDEEDAPKMTTTQPKPKAKKAK